MSDPAGGLTARGITRRFAGIVALDDLTLAAEPGEVTALIGPNGAGKTTLFNCLSGALTPDAGRVFIAGRDVTRLRPEQRVRAGLARTFQRLEIFTGMTVGENLQVAAETARGGRVLSGLLRWRPSQDSAMPALVDDVLRLLGLLALRDRPAAGLPTGILRLVEIGRALCTGPAVLLLDEPGSGLDAEETAALREVLRLLAAEGLTVVLIEHDLDLVLSLSAVVHVMDFGRLIATGSPAEIRASPAVRAAYLGSGAA